MVPGCGHVRVDGFGEVNVLITGSLHRSSVGIVPLSSGKADLKGRAGDFLGKDGDVLRSFELDDRQRGPQRIVAFRRLR